MIDITPMRLLPSHLSIALSGNRVGQVDIEYQWSPPICTLCPSFRHTSPNCSHRPAIGDAISLPPKAPIQKPPPRSWKFKSFPPPIILFDPHESPLDPEALSRLKSFIASTHDHFIDLLPNVATVDTQLADAKVGSLNANISTLLPPSPSKSKGSVDLVYGIDFGITDLLPT